MSDAREPNGSAPENEGRESAAHKTFWEHVEDFRWLVIKMSVTLGLSMILCFVFARDLLHLIMWPLDRVTAGNPQPFLLRTLAVTEGFTMSMKLAFFGGIILACPFLLWFLGSYLIPALNKRERKMLWPAFVASVILFLSGCALAYFAVIPAGLAFFFQYNDYLGLSSEWVIGSYVSFVSQMLLVFGVCFELPLVVLVLAKLELVTSRFLRDKRRVVIVLIFFASAIITPTTDVFTLCMLAIPMTLLYEACIWIAWWMERRGK